MELIHSESSTIALLLPFEIRKAIGLSKRNFHVLNWSFRGSFKDILLLGRNIDPGPGSLL